MNKYVVAVSGGVDSMYLLNKLNFNNQVCAVVHINHHTRGEDNERDIEIIKKYTTKHKIDLYVFDYYHKGGNFQAKAREFRYEKLNIIGCKYYQKIAFAHHLDDQLENSYVSTHVVKSNLMKYRTKFKDCYIYRPLLGVRKSFIYEQANKLKLRYNEDVSNFELKYERNKIRSELVNSSNQFFAQKKYLIENEKLSLIYKKQLSIERSQIRKQNKIYRYAAIYNLIKSEDSNIHVKNKQLEKIDNLLFKQGNSSYSFENSNVILIEYDKIYMLHYNHQIVHEDKLKLGENEFNGIKFDSIYSEGIIRTIKPGDKVPIRHGHKKVSRIFIDKKISKQLREKWPIIVNRNDEIIEIPQIWRKYEINK